MADPGFWFGIDEESATDRAALRGIDQTQMMLYGWAETIGSIFGVDWIQELGAEGVERNLIEIMENPPEVASWDDIDGLSTAATYIGERLSELIPQLAVQFAGGAVGGGIAKALGAFSKVAKTGTVAQKAALAKGIKRKIGFKPFDDALESIIKLSPVGKGVLAGAGATGVALNTGESRQAQLQEGIDNPEAALGTGIVKGLLDTLLIGRTVNVATKLGKPVIEVMDQAKKLALEAMKSGGLESVTEAAQTAVDFLAIKAQKPDFDLFSEDNFREIVDAAAVGLLAGGGVGAVSAGVQLANSINEAKTELNSIEQDLSSDPDALIDEPPNVVPIVTPEREASESGEIREELVTEDAETGQQFLFPVPGTQATIDSQFAALADDTSAKDTVVITPDEPLPTGVRFGGDGQVTVYGDALPGMRHYEVRDPLGFSYDVLTRSLEDATFLEQKGRGRVPTLTTQDFGRLMGRPEGDIGIDGTIITARDAAGRAVTDLATGPETFERDLELVSAQTPEGGTQEIRADVDAINERLVGLEDEAQRATLGIQLDERADVQELTIPDTEAPRRILPEYNNAGRGFDTQQEAIRRHKELERVAPDPNLYRDIEKFNGKWFVTQVPNPSGIATETDIPVNRGVPLTKTSAAVPLGERATSADRPTVRSPQQTTRDFVAKITSPAPDSRAGLTTGQMRKGLVNRETDKLRKILYDRTFITLKDPTGKEVPVTNMDIADLGTAIIFGDNENAAQIETAELAADAYLTGLRELGLQGFDVSDALTADQKRIKGDLIIKHGRIKDDPKLESKLTYARGRASAQARSRERSTVGFDDPSEVLSPNARRRMEQEVIRLNDLITEGGLEGDALTEVQRQEARVAGALERDETRAEEAGVSTTQEISDNQVTEELTGDLNRSQLQGGTTALPTRDPGIDELGAREARTPLQKAKAEEIPKLKLSANGRVQGIGASITQSDVDFVAYAFDEMGIEAPFTKIMDTNAFGTPDSLAFFRDAPRTERDIRKRFKEDAELMALTVRGPKGIMIVMRPIEGSSARAMRTLFLGHEVGHHVLDSIVSKRVSPEMRERLRKLWKADRDSNEIEAWRGKDGFKEWFADKVAARARNLTSKPESLVDTVFHNAAKTLQKLWRAMKGRLPERFKVNKSFGDVVTEMRHAGAFSGRELYTNRMGEIQEVHFDMAPIADYVSKDALAKRWPQLKELFTNADIKFSKYLLPLDSYLNSLPGGKLVGKILDHKIGTETPGNIPSITADGRRLPRGGQEYQQGVRAQIHRWHGELSKISSKYNEEVRKAGWKELAEERVTLDNPFAADVRQLLERYGKTYLQPSIPTLQLLENYFPRKWDTFAIAKNPKEWVALLRKHKLDDKVIDSITRHLNGEFHSSITKTAEGARDDARDIVGGWAKERQLKNPALIDEAVQLGFLNADPEYSLIRYFDSTIRAAEKNRVAGAWVEKPSPHSGLEESYNLIPGEKVWDSYGRIDKLLRRGAPEKYHKDILNAVDKTFHPASLDPNNPFHFFLGEVRAFFSMTTLAMSGVASIPEAGTLFYRMKGTMGLREYAKSMREIFKDVRNQGDLVQIAKDFGTYRNMVSSSMAGDLLTNDAIGRHGLFQKHLDKVFKYNGNDALVNFLRVAGTSMGKVFVTRLANNLKNGVDVTNSRRMLAELNIKDHNAVLRWEAAGYPTNMSSLSGQLAEDTKKVHEAIIQVIDEAVMAPTSSDRPIWSNHWIGQMLMHLKSFAFKYHKTVLGGMYKEMKNRRDVGELGQYMPQMAMVVFALMALAAVSDELRQRIASLGEKGTFAKQNYDPVDVFMRWFDKAGFFANPYHDFYTDPGIESAAYTAGPAVDWVHGLVTDNYGPDTAAIKTLRTVPILSQLPGLRRELLNAFD